jgi:hypothetical protein
MLQLHYCLSGFTQHNGRNSGVLKLSERLHLHGYSHGLESRVYLHPWKAHWPTVAEHAWLLSQLYETPLAIGIYAYSWGAGYGAIRLARELGERGIDVHQMVLCDPVPRPWLPLRWAALLPAAWGRSIRVPRNVAAVQPLVQRHNLPQGHRVVAADPGRTQVAAPLRLRVTHQYADDSHAFYDAALVAARRVRLHAGSDRVGNHNADSELASGEPHA